MQNRFATAVERAGLPPLTATTVDTLQVNLGKLCNQACRHCHVDAGPQQTGDDVNMQSPTVDHLLTLLSSAKIPTLDLTGGAPELNPNFRRLVLGARAAGTHVIDRCNLSVLFEPGQEDLAEFLATNRVEVVASLPYHKQDRTDRQRGAGVFDRSITGLKRLNTLGYGKRADLRLNLVFNPVGAYLPGDQNALEAEYKRELGDRHGIHFNHLYCITNMPINRFAQWLQRTGNLDAYMQTLIDAFNPRAVPSLMCRTLVSIAPNGRIHDCDFNQMLDIPLNRATPDHIHDFDADSLARRQITTGDHCLGCTAGAGSSCAGAVATK